MRSSVPLLTPLRAVILGSVSRSGRAAIRARKLAANVSRGRMLQVCRKNRTVAGMRV